MDTYWNSPDLVSYPADTMQVKGWQATKERTTRAFASMNGASLELLETNYKAISDLVISWGTWRLSMPSTAGSRVEVIGRYTDVKSQRGGKWVYILDHASVPLPPPTDQHAEQQ